MIDLNWTMGHIPLDWILVDDSPYDWKVGQADPLLQQSLKKNGILMPPILQEIGTKQYFLVDGFKRVRTLPYLKTKNATLFNCLVIAYKVSYRKVALWRLETLMAKHSYKGLEICRIFSALINFGFDELQLAKQILPMLGLKPSRKITQDLLKLVKILDLKESNSLEIYSAEDLLYLMKFSEDEIRILVRQLKALELGANKWKSLLQLFREVSRIQGWSLVQIMETPEIASILYQQQMQSTVRFRLLKQQLETWRFPELTASRKEFERNLKNLKIPTHSTIQYDPFFEKDELVLKLEASSLAELSEQLTILQTSTKQPAEWEKLFQLVQGNSLNK